MILNVETLNACPVCSRTQLRTLMQIPDFETGTGDYGLVECGNCGLAFTSPRPLESELPTLYADRTTTDFPKSPSKLVRRLREYAIDSYLSRTLGPMPSRHQAPFGMLDYGCGDGALACGAHRYAQTHGRSARITAIDFHDIAPPSLAGMGASEIRYMSHETWSVTDERYDAVFLRHVLEHHPEPRRLLGELRQVLRPGGRLFIEVPNRRSVWAGVFGRHYFGYYIPRHLMHFDRSSLQMAVGNSGLRCVTLTLGHVPILGASIAYWTGWKLAPLGLIALGSYPLQVAVDLLARTSTTLRLTAARDD